MRFGAWWVALCTGAALAQPLPALPDPDRLAEQLLGGERGAAVVAIARGTQTLRGSASRPERVIDADTALFEIGSVSKVFTGLLLAQAVERGELSLDDTLGQRLPRQTRDTPVAALTLRQLVTHSACLPRTLAAGGADAAAEIRTLTPAQLWDALPQLALAGQPPCAPRYSNLGMALLGNVLAQRYGQPWETLVRERIAAPLALQDTVQALDADRRARMLPAFEGETVAPLWDMDAYAGAGALRSSTADLLRFGQAILAGRDGPLGPAAERLVTPLGPYAGGEIGYGIFILGPPGRRVYLHDGLTGGYRTLWMLMPEGRQVLAASASNARAALPTLRGRVLAALFPVPSEPIPVAPAQLAPLSGEYRSGDGTLFRVLLHEGQLYARGGALGFAPLVPVGPGRFARPERGLLFQFDATAEPAHLTVQQGGAEQRAQRTARSVGMAIPARADVADAVGRYRLGNGAEFSIREEMGQLVARLAQQPAFPVFARPGQRDRYFYEVVPAELQFERGADGRVNALVLHQNGEHRAERIDAIP
ncbi:serine hydrolase [Pseudorhodoferax sp. Leaf274]|uniref:serine hydrolase n=1 Tax=Pseudorhodoferax sp. Leaf274 TaxID=1736318 RepID=UPI00070361E7|nr:serine hydrolase [Pseudorhodoferax sp. Leaf274]KQP46221.1 hypothetical protein ASF44_24860 [Pseudorhodoferax sp. Leaf274]